MTHRPALVAIFLTAVLATAGACAHPVPATGLGTTGHTGGTSANSAPIGRPAAGTAAGAASTGHSSTGSVGSTSAGGSAGLTAGGGAATGPAGGTASAGGGQVPPSAAGRFQPPPVGATVSAHFPEDWALAYAHLTPAPDDPLPNDMVCGWQSDGVTGQFILSFEIRLLHTGGLTDGSRGILSQISIGGLGDGQPVLVTGLDTLQVVGHTADHYRNVKFAVDLLVKDDVSTNNHAATTIEIPTGGPVADGYFHRLPCYPTF